MGKFSNSYSHLHSSRQDCWTVELTGIFPTSGHSPFVSLQMAVDQAHRQNLSSLFLPVFESVNPCLILMVRRDNIVGDAVEVLRKTKNVDYKKPLKVLQHTLLPVIEKGQTFTVPLQFSAH